MKANYLVYEVGPRMYRCSSNAGYITLEGALGAARNLARKKPGEKFVIYAPIVEISHKETTFNEEVRQSTLNEAEDMFSQQ